MPYSMTRKMGIKIARMRTDSNRIDIFGFAADSGGVEGDGAA